MGAIGGYKILQGLRTFGRLSFWCFIALLRVLAHDLLISDEKIRYASCNI